MAVYCWLAVFLVLLLIEMSTMALTTIWFAGGALVSCLLAVAGVDIRIQLAVFVVVSFALLVFTRPVMIRFVNSRTKKTNVDSLIGKKARVSETIHNELGIGAAVLNGQEWMARSEKDEDIIEEGTLVEVAAITGVKLIVKRREEE